MKKKYLKTLEYDKVLKKISLLAHSEAAKKEILNTMPYEEFAKVEEMLLDTADAVVLTSRKGRPSLSGIKNVESITSRLAMGGILGNRELLTIRENLYLARRTKEYLRESNPEMDESGKRIKEKLQELFINKSLENEIQRCILNDDEIADDASHELFGIRNTIRRKQDSIRDRLNDYIRSSKYSKYIQDNVITIRNGRYVIPVKQESKSNLKGIVHDSSASGSTVYIEPMDIVNLNNDIRELEAEEKEEMDKIRAELSEAASPYTEDLNCNYRLLVFSDVLFSKAELMLDEEYMIPRLNRNRVMRLVKARHPLIDKKVVVPIDFHIGEDFTTLVITGPNTGGKTVSLKTVGLLCAMAQSGFPIPAREGTEICIFNDIYADIGDEQSIEQSLSTFSSHMTNIISILKYCDDKSLVLLDELGAGTDPVEGSALALAILEQLMEKGCTTVATTHYQHIKIYASVTEGIENASCEFDVSTLRPTYRLLIGIPGKSNALYISRRLGLHEKIIKQAKGFIDNDNTDYEDVILSLEKSRQRIEKEKKKAIKNTRETKTLRDDLDKQLNRIEGERKRILNEARREAEKILSDSRIKADEFLEELKTLKKEQQGAGSARIEAQFRSKYKDTFEKSKMESHVNTTNDIIVNSDYLPKAGDDVFLTNLNANGTILEANEKTGEATVQAGIMKLKVPFGNIRQIDTAKRQKETISGFSVKKSAKNPSLELDIRGLASDEVDIKVGKFIDDSALMSIGEVYIIHGKGSGRLRTAVQSFLKNNPHVDSYRTGNFGEGESGVTVVKLK